MISEPVIDTQRELLWLRRLRDLTRRLTAETDSLKLLPLILDSAIELTRAERGFLVLLQGWSRAGTPRLKVEGARGFDKETLQGGLGKISRTVVARVLERGGCLVTSSEEDRDIREVTSVRDRRVLSIVCVPLEVRGEIRGVLYLDHRFDPDAFTQQDAPVLTTFANQAALALETSELVGSHLENHQHLSGTLREIETLETARSARDQVARRPLPSPNQVPRFGQLVGDSQVMHTVYREIERAARSLAPVLITGPSGTGKELVAHEIHRRGPNPSEPFLSENCAAISDGLMESELFGHTRGSFTGAEDDRKGLFVLARGGTLFLDEVGDMSPTMQGKLLRVLQEGQLRPVGGEAFVPVTCRVVAASLHDLRKRVDSERFREDLYYRLDVLRIHVPPLAERTGDIPALLSHFFAEAGSQPLVHPDALSVMLTYSWPGNVRELQNEVRRLCTLEVKEVRVEHLSPELRDDNAGSAGVSTRVRESYAGKTLPEVEREMLAAALRKADGNKAQAARQLGIPKSTIYHLMDRHGLRSP